jgi:RNA-directed DNA polymerase
MMHGPEKSDPVIVAGKPTNKAERSAAELAEPRTGTKGNAGELSTSRTQSRIQRRPSKRRRLGSRLSRTQNRALAAAPAMN